MPTQAPTLTIKVPVRLLFTNTLIAPAPFRGKGGTAGAPRYNVQCLIEAAHPQLGEIQQLVMAVANEAFPGRQWPTTANNGLPLKNGATLNAERVAAGRQPYDCYNGHFVLFTQKPEKSQAGTILDPPVLKVLMSGEYVEFAGAQRPLAKEYFYNGVRAVGEFQLKAFAGFGGGVTCYLNRIYSLNVGEKIAVGKDDEERFGSIAEMAQYQGSVSTVNPLAPVRGQPW